MACATAFILPSPVERDSSNGEQQPRDGRTITLNGLQYAKGLGDNAVSDVALYLGGNCARFTATVGVDDEVGTAGSITFSVIADGRTLTTTPVLTGSSASVPLDVDVTGAQRLDLLTGGGGDGNGLDHGDWADAKLVCKLRAGQGSPTSRVHLSATGPSACASSARKPGVVTIPYR